MRKHSLLASLLTIALCLSMIVGSTYALFTSEDNVTIEATGAKIKVSASVGALSLTSMGDETVGGVFTNGGTADYNRETGVLTLSRLTPGDAVSFGITLKNESDVNILYRLTWEIEGALADALSVTVDGAALVAGSSEWTAWEAPAEESETMLLPVSIALPITAGNSYMEATATIRFKIEAIQGNAPTWDGTADTTWYNEEATEFALTNSAQFAGLAELVDSGVDFTGKTIKLEKDLDLRAFDEEGNLLCFDPIGSYRNEEAFRGTFDGNGYTISNLNQNTWELNNGYYYGDLGLGLFAYVEDATIKNLTMDGAEISGESGLVGIVAATAYGDCTFENITVSNSKGADYQYYAGGVVGWASGNQTYRGIVVDETTVIGSQWGDFGNASGGIIGGAGTSGTYHFEDCVVACRIDAVNDIVSAYQWYCYRNCGMLIGKVDSYRQNEVVSVVAENVTCENVTVIYGDWANYTYCEFAGTGYPYVRVQAGASVDAYSNVRYGHPTDANGNTVVDDNHVHNEGEDHQLLLAFDQLFGGPAEHRYCYYGVSEHEGVSVTYRIGTAESLVAFGKRVADGKTYKDATVVLTDDIDMTGIDWEPIAWDNTSGIGFAGTFDGQGHTIKNLSVEGGESVGFFKSVKTTAVIKNTVFDGAAVSGTHYVGVVIGWEGNESANATIENITVKNSTVTCDTDATLDNGDKAGGIVGYAVSLNIVGCTVEDTTVKAYRDFGGIIGYANSKVVLTGNTVKNVTLVIDNDENYKNYTTDAEHDGNPIVGEAVEGAVLDNNTVIPGNN